VLHYRTQVYTPLAPVGVREGDVKDGGGTKPGAKPNKNIENNKNKATLKKKDE
jgi:hypothetical protein